MSGRRITLYIPDRLAAELAKYPEPINLSHLFAQALTVELIKRQTPRHERMWKERLALVRQGTTAA